MTATNKAKLEQGGRPPQTKLNKFRTAYGPDDRAADDQNTGADDRQEANLQDEVMGIPCRSQPAAFDKFISSLSWHSMSADPTRPDPASYFLLLN